MDKNVVIKSGLYRHFKGFICEVIGVAKHSETGDEVVVYRHDGQWWVRPVAMFLEAVEKDGQTMPRFTFLGKLVRDGIPAIIAAEGKTAPAHVAVDREEYRRFLGQKLAEEVEEFRQADSDEARAEELADLLEIVTALSSAYDIDDEVLGRIMEEKRMKRGGFEQRMILEDF